MVLEELNKKYNNLKFVADTLKQSMKKFEGSVLVENYLDYETLKTARECVIAEINRFEKYDWQ